MGAVAVAFIIPSSFSAGDLTFKCLRWKKRGEFAFNALPPESNKTKRLLIFASSLNFPPLLVKRGRRYLLGNLSLPAHFFSFSLFLFLPILHLSLSPSYLKETGGGNHRIKFLGYKNCSWDFDLKHKRVLAQFFEVLSKTYKTVRKIVRLVDKLFCQSRRDNRF